MFRVQLKFRINLKLDLDSLERAWDLVIEVFGWIFVLIMLICEIFVGNLICLSVYCVFFKIGRVFRKVNNFCFYL